MNEYIVIIEFASPFSDEFIALISEQQAQVDRLMKKGILTSYSLSADQKKLWMTLLASSLEAVEKTLRMMPLYKFMHYDIIKLMFHNSPVYAPMHFSVN